jgi:hypothetical protein
MKEQPLESNAQLKPTMARIEEPYQGRTRESMTR